MPSLAFLGTVTFCRLMQTAIEDAIHAPGINRIRHYYVELAPPLQRYFIHSIHDDTPGTLHDLGVLNPHRQHLLTNAWTVAVINGVIVHRRYWFRRWADAERQMPPLFPSVS
jgi:hypothetical protein